MEINKKNNAYTIVKTLCKFRMKNMENEDYKNLIKSKITHNNLTDDSIKQEFILKTLSDKDLINKVNDALYSEKPKQDSIKQIEKICRRNDINNKYKINIERRKRIMENLKNSKIKDICSKERTINIILDNARIHIAIMVQEACEILNINLIFLPKYSPDLNPIEDLWRKIKLKIYNFNYKDLFELSNEFKNQFYKNVDLKSFYEEWINEYMT